MPGFSEFGRMLLGIGVLCVLLGGFMMLAGRIPGIGRLPGDIYVHRGNFTFYFPLATCILISLALTVISWLFGRK